MVRFQTESVLVVPHEDVVRLSLSVPAWREFADPAGAAHRGLVRHGGLDDMVNHVPAGCKFPYAEHAHEYLRAVGDPGGTTPRTLLLFGTRNSGQNLGLPAYSARHSPPLMARPDEPWQDWTYHGLCVGRGGRVAIEAVRFGPTPRIIGAAESIGDPDFVVAGQPLLWDGEVTPIPQLAACTYDLRHVFHMLWQVPDRTRFPMAASDKEAHDELMAGFMAHLRSPLSVRAAVLAEIAARRGLRVTEGYLHSSVGLRPDGALVLLAAHGSLTAVAERQRALGSTRAVLLDNGGSVGYGLYSRRDWRADAWSAGPLPPPTFFGTGSYFRPRGHAVFVLELAGDLLELPFVHRPSGYTPWPSA